MKPKYPQPQYVPGYAKHCFVLWLTTGRLHYTKVYNDSQGFWDKTDEDYIGNILEMIQYMSKCTVQVFRLTRYFCLYKFDLLSKSKLMKPDCIYLEI